MVFFLIFPQNMHCGYSLGPPDIEAVLKSKHNPCFIGAKDCVPTFHCHFNDDLVGTHTCFS